MELDSSALYKLQLFVLYQWHDLNQNPRSDLPQRSLCLKFGVCHCLGRGTKLPWASADCGQAKQSSQIDSGAVVVETKATVALVYPQA